ncbi:MAG: PTS sugar transporter subunit IIA [Candidatus Binatia bacterium]
MRIADILDAAMIIPSLKGTDKNAVLEEMAELAASHDQFTDSQRLLEILLAREKIGSTAIGEGVAIPHGKVPGVQRVFAVFARSPRGIDFQAQDGSLTYLFFLLIAPEDSTSDHLKALARVTRLLKNGAFRTRLTEGRTREEILSAIREEDRKL